MKFILTIFFSVMSFTIIIGQNKTDISLKWKDKNQQEKSITSESGDLYSKLSHHGPAIENEWMALRLYFDYKCAIDVYNKTQTQLELAEAQWYPTPEQQKEGWGADQYKVGETVGLGGVRLWDGEKAVFLNPVTSRTARVVKEANTSYMEMLSKGIPYQGDSIDILVRVTVFSGFRKARVEAFALSKNPVQFLTGVNFHNGMEVEKGNAYVVTWGTHPEDVAAFQMAIGAGIVFNPDDYEDMRKTDNEYQLISRPAKYLKTWISSSSEKDPELDSMDEFVEYLKELDY